MHQQRAVVIIPIYTSILNQWELISLRQCVKVLANHPLVFVSPCTLDTSELEKMFGVCRVERFDDRFFIDLAGYNRLMLTPEFYERFADYEYMLIHQLDAYVFSDRLAEWCDRGYDYVGAPWLPTIKYKATWRRVELVANQFLTRLLGIYNTRSNYFRTGNGGFSLRKIAPCLAVTKNDARMVERFLSRDSYHYAEDIYWSIHVNRIKSRLSIPHCGEAIDFAFENHPAQLYERNEKRLPFGAHAWYKGDRLDFWRRFIEMPDEVIKI